jgi:hypothetical protein
VVKDRITMLRPLIEQILHEMNEPIS